MLNLWKALDGSNIINVSGIFPSKLPRGANNKIKGLKERVVRDSWFRHALSAVEEKYRLSKVINREVIQRCFELDKVRSVNGSLRVLCTPL